MRMTLDLGPVDLLRYAGAAGVSTPAAAALGHLAYRTGCNVCATSHLFVPVHGLVCGQDVIRLAEAGITHVRIPVGYWIMGDIRAGEPWVTGELTYLQRAMHWFKASHLKVVFDLHCAPGSQNGFDNSGRKVLHPDHFIGVAAIPRL